MSTQSLPVVAGVEHDWVDVDGVKLHLAQAGIEHRSPDRPTLVLIHGWPQHWFCWRHVMVELAQTHHVIAVDLRGAGWSDAPRGTAAYDKRVMADEIARLCEVLELSRPVLVGHDWGAWVSLLVASRHPELPAGVVAAAIVAPWVKAGWSDLWRFSYQLIAGGPGGSWLHAHGGQLLLKTVLRLGSSRGFSFDPADRQEYLDRFVEPARAKAGRSMYRQFLCVEIGQTLRRKYAEKVREVPLLFLPGRHDGVLTPRLVSSAAGPANVTVNVIENSGHWVPEEQPAALAGQVRGFVAGLAR